MSAIRFALPALLSASSLHAQTLVIWSDLGTQFSGGGSGPSWVDGAAPINDLTSSIAIFGNSGESSRTNPDFLANRTIAGLRFHSDALSYTLRNTDSSQPTVTLGASGIDNNAPTNAQTIASSLSLALGASSTFSNAGTLTVDAAVALHGFDLTLNGSGAGGTVSGIISGNGSLTKASPGTWTLTRANTFTGSTTILNGTLVIDGEANLGANPTADAADNLKIDNGGTLHTTADFSINDSRRGVTIAIDGGAIDVLGGTTLTIENVIAGSGVLTKAGDGTLTLTETNTLSGGLLITSGNVQLGASGTVLKNTLPVTVNAGTFILGAANETIGSLAGTDGSVSLGGQQLTTGGNDGTTTFSGAIHDGSLVKSGTGTLTLGGTADNGSLTVDVADGRVELGKTSNSDVHAATTIGGIASGSSVKITGTGGDQIFDNGGAGLNSVAGTFDLNGNSETVGQFTGSSTGVVRNSSATASTLTVGFGDATGANLSYSGVIQNGTGAVALTKIGAGTLTLSGANTYTGGTALNAGVTALGSSGALGGSGTISFGGGTLQFSAANTTDYSSRFAISSGQSYNIDTNGQNVAFNSSLDDATLNKSGSGTLTLGGSGDNSSLAVEVSGGTLSLGKSSNSGVHATAGIGSIASGATVKLAGSGGDQIPDSIFTGIMGVAGTFDLNGRSETVGFFTGTTSGVVTNTSNTAATLTVGFGGVSGTNLAFAGNIEDGNGRIGLTKTGGGTLVLSGANNFTGPLTLADGIVAFTTNSQVIGSLAGVDGTTVRLGGQQLTTGANNASTTFSGSLLNGTLVKSGSGTLTLDGTVDNSSFVINVSGGTVKLGKTSASTVHATRDVGSIASGATVKLTGSGGDQIYDNPNGGLNDVAGTFDLNGNSETVGQFTGSSTGIVTNSSSTAAILTVGSANAGGGNLSFSGELQDGVGALGLTKIGSGTLSLSGANAFTGGLTVDQGTVAFSTNSQSVGSLNGVAGTTVALGNQQLTVGTNQASTTFSGTLRVGTLVKSGGGTLKLEGTADNASLTLNVSGGAVELAKTSDINVHAVSSIASIASGSTVYITGTGDDQIYDGAGLTGLAGIFDLNGHSETVGRFNGSATGVVRNSSGTASTLTVGFDNHTGANLAFPGVIQNSPGSVALTKIGTGTLTLSGANTYTGATTIAAGTLQFAKPASLYNNNAPNWTAANLVVSSGATAAFNVGAPGEFTSGNITTLAALGTASGGFADGSFLGLDTTNASGGTFTLSGSIANPNGGANSLSLIKLGDGTLNLSGDNTYDGGTTLASGTLALGSGGALGSSGTISFLGGTLQFSAANTTDYSSRFASNQARNIDTNGQVVAFASAITGNWIVKSGAGTLTLGGTADNASLAVNVADGTVELAKTSAGTVHAAMTISSIAPGATVRLAGTGGDQIYNDASVGLTGLAGTFDLNGNSETVGQFTGSATGVITNSSGTASTLTVGFGNTTGANLSFPGVIQNGTGTVALAKTGTGTLVLEGANTYTGGTTITGGVVQIGAGGTTGSILGNVTNNAALVFDRSDALSFPGVISGSGSVSKSGLDTLTLSGASTYSGATTINSGVLNVRHATALGSSSGRTTVTGGTALELQGGITIASEPLTLNGAGASANGALRNISDANASNGTITLAGATEIQSDAGTLTLGGGITGAFDLTFDGAGATSSSGSIGTGSGSLTKLGGGTLTLSGANTFAGTTSVNAGVLNIRHATALGSAAAGTTIANGTALELQGGITVASEALSLVGSGISSNGALRNISGTNTYNGALALAGATKIQSDAGTLILGGGGITGAFGLTFDGAGATTISGAIGTGSGTLTKSGAGTLTLSGANTYTGPTTVTAGTLQFAKQTALYNNTPASWTAANLTVASGATAAFNVGGTGEFTASDITALAALGTATTGFRSGATLGLDTTNATGGTFTYGNALTNSNGGANARGLTKLGGGTLTLPVANTFTGATTVSSGALNVQHASALGTSAAGTFVTSGAALELQGGITIATEALTLSGTGISSNGALRNISGANAYNGAISLASSAQIQNDADTLTLGAGGISGGFHLTIDGAGATNISGAIGTGGGALTKTGSGTLTLSGANTYTGVTTVTGGTLRFARQTALYNNNPASWTAANLTFVSGATAAFNVGGTGEFTSPDITALAALGTLSTGFRSGATLALDTTNAPSGSFLHDGQIANPNAGANTLGLAKFGPGTLVLSANNTYTGLTLISTGTLQLGTGGTTGGVSGNIANQGTLRFNRSDLVTFPHAISGTGNLTQAGSGTVTLSGANTYLGHTTVTAGTLSFATQTSLYNNAPVRWTAANLTVAPDATAAFHVGGTGEFTSADIDTLSALGTATAGFQSGASLGLYTAGTFTHGTAIQNPNAGANTLGLAKFGPGTLVLSANNTYTGLTLISTGTLQLGAGGTTGTVAGEIANYGTLIFNRSGAVAFPHVISGSGDVTQASSGTLTLTGANTYTGTTNISSGTLLATTNNALGYTGSGTTVYSGATLALSGGFNYTTRETVTLHGTGSDGHGGALGNIAGNNLFAGVIVVGSDASISTASGTRLTLSGETADAGEIGIPVYTEAGTLTFTGAGTTILTGDASHTRTTISGGTLQIGAGGTTGTIAGQITNQAAIVFNRSNSSAFGGTMSGPGTLTKNGAGTLTLGTPNTFSGGSALNEGTVAMGAPAGLGTGPVALNGAALRADGGARAFANATTLNAPTSFVGSQPLTLSGPLTLAGSHPLTVTSTVPTTISGAIGESELSTLIKQGASELRLTGANTYTGGTTINAGTLRINNSTGSAFGSGSVTVANGATLTGGGSFTGALQLAGTLSPGNSPGLLTIGSGSVLAGTTLIELGGTTRGFTYDAINVAGAGQLTLGGTLDVVLFGDWTPTGSASFQIFQATSFGGTFAQVNLPSIAGYTWNTSQLETLGTLGLSAIPEPTAFAALTGLGTLALAATRRRRT